MTRETRETLIVVLAAVLLVGGMLFCLAKAVAQPAGCDLAQPHPNPIVYTSSPRNMTPLPPYEDSTLFQTASDVQFLRDGFEETDLEIKNPDGSIVVVHNCTASPVACAAQEGRVSPDGKRIVYSLTVGRLWQHNGNKAWFIGSPVESKLRVYDITSKTSREIPNQQSGVVNRQPEWLDDNRLVYSSDAANLYGVRDQWNCHQGVWPAGTMRDGADIGGKPRGYAGGNCISQTYPDKSLQIWRMNVDGTAQVTLTPHEYQAIRPTVLRHPNNKGRIAYSSHQSGFDKAYYGAGAGPSTTANLWWICTIDENGGSAACSLGAHHSGYLNKEAPAGMQQIDEFMALRSVGEMPDGRLCATNYYRGNHFGLGTLWCFDAPLGDFQVEGCQTQDCYTRSMGKTSRKGSGQYVPPDLVALYTAGVGSDNIQNRDGKGRVTGKMGYVTTLQNGHPMATWGQGLCHNEGINPLFDGTTASIGNQPLCDRNIVELLQPQVSDPFNPKQVKLLVASPFKHEWDAQEIVAKPVTHKQPPLDASKGCYIEVVDIRNSETHSKERDFAWNRRASFTGVQGNTVNPFKPEMHKANTLGLAFFGHKLHSTNHNDPKFKAAVNYTGFEDSYLLGVQPMMADGSVKARVPCDVPLSIGAVDATGKVHTHDDFLQSLRPGETRTCHGCHDAHSTERFAELGKIGPQERFAKTLAYNTTPALLSNQARVTFSEVAPIITKACSSCHAGFQNDSLLWSRVFADQSQLDFPWMKKMKNYNGGFDLPRPYYSGLVARYADWSMLYWVMTGNRTDGYTNADFADDQDYPTGHPVVNLTPTEVKKVVDYIQLGAPRP